jgi:hypothetical protein
MRKVTWLALVVSVISWAQAPATDRVGFPEGYQKWTMLYTLDRSDNKQVRTIYGNDIAAGVKDGGQANYPYGSVVVLETQAALKDADGNAVLDKNGRYQKDPAAAPTINTMRKEKGFGAAYGPLRNGEWEYVAYTPAKVFSTAPQNSTTCANCHLQAGQGKDWVFRASGHFKNGNPDFLGAVPSAIIKNYAFVPGVLTVKAGSFVTFYNDDVVAHNIADDFQGGWISANMQAGSGTQAIQFTVPGEFNFHCAIHPGMKGKIVVVP